MSTRVLHLTNAIGLKISVEIGTGFTPVDVMRSHGAEGWASGEPPEGGWVLPFSMRDCFDWRLIGARPFEYEGVQMVERLGVVWKRREWPANAAKKMPAAVAYSRGATGEERDEGKEQKDDYVRLITFKSNGPAIKEWSVPAATKNGGASSRNPAASLKTEPRTITPTQVERLLNAMEKLKPLGIAVYNTALKDALGVVGRPVTAKEELSEVEAALVIAKLNKQAPA